LATESHGEESTEAVVVTELNSKTLADLIAKRHHCLVKLRDLGLKQAELIAAGDMGPLLRLLAAKNQWIVAVQTIEKELTPYHEQDPEKRVWASKDARSQCASQALQCKQLLDEVMQMELQNEQKMTERRDQVANQLQMAHAAGSVCSAYQAQQQTRKVGQPLFARETSQSATTPNPLPTSHQ
jgi:hypothetical protein